MNKDLGSSFPQSFSHVCFFQESSRPSNHVAVQSSMMPSRAGETSHFPATAAAAAASSQSLYNLLLAVSLMGISTSWPDQCKQEPIGLLGRMIEVLGNSSGDTMLYTPQDITVCYADNLKCFYEELHVIQEEHEAQEEVLSWLFPYLRTLMTKLQAEGWSQHCPTCWPCECHPKRTTAIFLKKFQQLFQFSCKTSGSLMRRDCPPLTP